VTDARIAPPVSLRDGHDLTGIDILIRSEPKFNVSGRFAPPAEMDGPFSAVSIVLVPRDPAALSLTSTQSVLGPDARDGRFSISGVPAGDYELFGTMRQDAFGPRGGDPPPQYVGRVRIDVRDSSLDNVEIRMERGVELRARLLVDGTPSSNGKPAGIQLKSLETFPRPFEDLGRMGMHIDAAGLMVFRRLPEGRYTFQLEPVATPLPGVYIADIRESGLSVLDEGIVLNGRTPGPVDVLVSTKGERMTGIVRNGQTIVPNARVALVPKEDRRRNLALFKTALADARGAFTLEAIAPGDYKLFAWETTPPNAYFNTEFLANHEARGQSVIVKGGATLHIEAQAIMETKKGTDP
jgi:hypothetical protein